MTAPTHGDGKEVFRYREGVHGEHCIDRGIYVFDRIETIGRAASEAEAKRIVEALNGRLERPMIEPTQAQIEAALNELRKHILFYVPDDGMKAALTAAAQVGELTFVQPTQNQQDYLERIQRSQSYDPSVVIGGPKKPKLDAATIKRCAQICDELADQYGGHIGIVLRRAATRMRN